VLEPDGDAMVSDRAEPPDVSVVAATDGDNGASA
jgi:hypothetical protein